MPLKFYAPYSGDETREIFWWWWIAGGVRRKWWFIVDFWLNFNRLMGKFVTAVSKKKSQNFSEKSSWKLWNKAENEIHSRFKRNFGLKKFYLFHFHRIEKINSKHFGTLRFWMTQLDSKIFTSFHLKILKKNLKLIYKTSNKYLKKSFNSIFLFTKVFLDAFAANFALYVHQWPFKFTVALRCVVEELCRVSSATAKKFATVKFGWCSTALAALGSWEKRVILVWNRR